MSVIAGVHGVVPEHAYSQDQITAELADVLVPAVASTVDGLPPRRALMHRLHAAAGVDRRHFVLPLERYRDLGGFGPANDVFLEYGPDLAARAITGALERAGLTAADVDLLMSVSVTGIAAPSIEARLQPRLGLRPDVKRVPVFGLGCVAGAAGIARLHDYLLGHPDGVAVLLSVELCSLTFQADDASTANLVSTGLFGDGAAAVVVVGRHRAERLAPAPAPRVVDTCSRLYPDTERVMGWDIGGTGFRIVLPRGGGEPGRRASGAVRGGLVAGDPALPGAHRSPARRCPAPGATAGHRPGRRDPAGTVHRRRQRPRLTPG